MLSSVPRHPNGKLLRVVLAIILCYCGYSAILLWSGPQETPLPAPPIRKAPTYLTVTQTVQAPATTYTIQAPPATFTVQASPAIITVQAPAQTVTVRTEVLVPRAEPAPPPLVNGPPTLAFKENLRPELQYITSWPAAGFSNDVIGYMNLIYLALLTQRVPIVPFFRPTHITKGDNHHGPNIDFGDVFDIPQLERAIGKPVLEWWKVKARDSKSVDPLGCWNVWEAVKITNKGPHMSSVPDLLKLDISYTTAPTWIKLLPDVSHDPHMTYASLVALSFPEKRNENLRTPVPSTLLKVSLPPDDQLLCFDDLYYASTSQIHEMQRDFSPSWRFVGQHLHWAPKIEALAQQYLRSAFGLPPSAPIPPYIAIHVRHGDFHHWCGSVPLSECFAPLPVIARRVDEVRADLLKRKGLKVDRVVMTSDEKDDAWWAPVRALGWAVPDHSDTVRLHDKWYPMLIDGAIQSGGMGFVGTDQSTVSILAGRRVRSWRNGEVRTVKWGRVGADDH